MKKAKSSPADKQKLNSPKTRHGKMDLPNANLAPWAGGKKFAGGGSVRGDGCATKGRTKKRYI